MALSRTACILYVCLWNVLCVKSDLDKTNFMKIRCRAQCLKKFYQPEVKLNCEDDSDCYMCWDTCDLFYTNFDVWGPMCDDREICLRYVGCRESCDFYTMQGEVDDVKDPRESYRFVDGIRTWLVPQKDSVTIQWERPTHLPSPSALPLAYVIFIQDPLGSQWEQLAQTFYRNVTLRRGLVEKRAVRFRVVAYDTFGEVTRIEMSAADIFSLSTTDQMALDEGRMMRAAAVVVQDNSRRENATKSKWKLSLVSLRTSTKTAGGLDALISWSPPAYKAGLQLKYEIVWKIMDASMEVTGRMYTSGVAATLPLWGASVYSVHLRAYPIDADHVIDQSEPLIIDTRKTTLKHNFQLCTRCIPTNVAALSAAALVTFMLLVFVATLLLLRSLRRKPSLSSEQTFVGAISSKAAKKLGLESAPGVIIDHRSHAHPVVHPHFGEATTSSEKKSCPTSPIGNPSEELLEDNESVEGNYFVFDVSRKSSLKRQFSRGHPV